MKYVITRAVLGRSTTVDISQYMYKKIKSAIEQLREAYYLEQKFDLLVEDYYEFELDLLSSATRSMIFQNKDYDWFFKESSLHNRRMINLLSAGKLFLDHSLHHLSSIYGNDSKELEEIKKHRSEQYDNHLGYRVVEALRNYVQHRGFPIQSIKFNSKEASSAPKRKIKFSITPYIVTSSLEQDPKFKKSVIKDLKKTGDKVDLKQLVREYIDCLARIQRKVRDILKDDIQKSEKTFFKAMDLFKKNAPNDEPSIGVVIVGIDSNNLWGIEPIHLLEENIDHREKLESKNFLLDNISTRFVTGEVIE